MLPVIPAPFFTYSNKELTFDNSLYIFLFPYVLTFACVARNIRWIDIQDLVLSKPCWFTRPTDDEDV